MSSLRSALGIQELTDKKSNLYRALVAEFLGTLFLNFYGCGAAFTGDNLTVSVSFGLAVAAAIQFTGHVSGGHVNPAVTAGLLAIGKIPVVRAVLYVIAQCAGAIAGSAVLRALSDPAGSFKDQLGHVLLKNGIEPAQGLGVEFFMAMILVLVVCGACDPGKPESKPLAPLIIGLTVTLCHITGIPRTNTGMNPARALGAAVIEGMYDNHWLYWVGPILGGVAGSLIYTHAIGPAKEPEQKSYSTVATEEKELHRLTGRKGAQNA